MVANWMIAAAEPSGLIGLYIVTYVTTAIFTAAVTNNAAITIMFPIAYEASTKSNVGLAVARKV